jgi:hypothetical protein
MTSILVMVVSKRASLSGNICFAGAQGQPVSAVSAKVQLGTCPGDSAFALRQRVKFGTMWTG